MGLNTKLGTLVAIGGFGLLSAAAAPRKAAFSVVVTRRNQEWIATCEAGCRWERVTASKPRLLGRSVWIDNTGIDTWGSGPVDTATTWGFKLTGGNDGWSASDAHGTSWSSLVYSCTAETCTARITDEGVEGMEAAWDSTVKIGWKVHAWSRYPQPGWRDGIISKASIPGGQLCPVVHPSGGVDVVLLIINAVDSLERQDPVTGAWHRVDMEAVKEKYKRCRA